MARNNGSNRTFARNRNLTANSIDNAERHNERKNESYTNPDIVPEESYRNIHFKQPTDSYGEMFDQMVQDGVISTRGLKPDATHFCELIFDVNSAYFYNHGGYEFAKKFYTDAYQAAVKIVGGEQYILSAILHADERNRAMSDALGQDVFHYHLHVVYIPVVEKEILWSKRCKDHALVGTVKETIMQVSRSKKWASPPATNALGIPLVSKSGKPVLKPSYSVLQDDFFNAMRAAGYDDVERGQQGSTEEHLTVTQFKVMKEQENLNGLIARQQNAMKAAEMAETHRREIEQEAEAAKKELNALAQNAKDTETFIQKLGSADTLLPDAGMLETGKGYQTNKALLVVQRLIRKLKTIYQLLLNEREISNSLTRDVVFWRRKAEVNSVTQDKAAKMDRLTKVLGIEKIERLLTPCRFSGRMQHHTHDYDR